MRPIPPSLLEKINLSMQTIGNNANPRMDIISSASENELFRVYTIHNKPPADIDTTLKRSTTSGKPHEAYTIYIDAEDHSAHALKKDLPYDPSTPWDYQFRVDTAVSVAIEFNGYWERDKKTRRHNFVTEDVPWIFWSNPLNNLQAQRWDDSESRITLTENISKVAAIRGWIPAQTSHNDDQGLIVAYIKGDGKIYYRNYCYQEGGYYLWENEKQVTQLPNPADNIALFRTNDFRIGFMVEVSGEIFWAITERNWSGMSVWPEAVKADFRQFEVSLIPIEYKDGFDRENVVSIVKDFNMLECMPIYPQIVVIKNPFNVDNVILIEASHDLVGDSELDLSGFKNRFIVRDSNNRNFVVTSAERHNSNTIRLNTDRFTVAIGDLTVTYTGVTDLDTSNCLRSQNQGCHFPIDSFSISFKPVLVPPEGHTVHNIKGTLPIGLSVDLKRVYYTDGIHDHNIRANFVNFSVVLTKVNNDPL